MAAIHKSLPLEDGVHCQMHGHATIKVEQYDGYSTKIVKVKLSVLNNLINV